MKKLYFSLLVVLFIFIGTLVVSANDVFIVDEHGNEYAHTSYTFYLPSHISPSSLKFKLAEDIKLSYETEDGYKDINNGDTVDFSSYKMNYNGKPIYLVNAQINSQQKYFILQFASTLPSIYITTSVNSEYIIAYSMKDEAVKTSVILSDGTLLHKDETNTGELKIRGNATTQYAKKPFQLKLSSKAGLFDMASDKTWVLLANYDDQSLIRNSVMYHLGKRLGIRTCDFQSVDLFINGSYYGVYLLCEKVEIDKGRVEIFDLEEENDKLNSSYLSYSTTVNSGELIDTTILTEYRYVANVSNPENITGGYLIELDNNYYKNELCYFTTENGNHYVIKSPDHPSREQVEYIAKLFADMEEAIMSYDGYNRQGKHYTDYVDIDSLASAYILQEFGRNYDAGSSSLYFYKDIDANGTTSKIFKGPLWDCDNTLGNIHKNDASNPEGYWAKDRSIWKGLTKKPEFNRLVTEKFSQIYDHIFDMIDYGGFIEKQVDEIGDSIYMEISRWNSDNYEKWPLYYDGIHYDKWQSGQVFHFVDTYSSGLNEDSSTVIGYLCEHIEARANWLAKEWDCQVTIRERNVEPPVIDDSTESKPSDEVPPDNVEPPSTEEPPSIDELPSNDPPNDQPEVEPQKLSFFDFIIALLKAIFDAIKKLFGFE